MFKTICLMMATVLLFAGVEGVKINAHSRDLISDFPIDSNLATAFAQTADQRMSVDARNKTTMWILIGSGVAVVLFLIIFFGCCCYCKSEKDDLFDDKKDGYAPLE